MSTTGDTGGKPGALARMIKALRERLGLRQQKLAKMTDLSQARISQIENMTDAQAKSLDNAVLLRLAHVLGAEVLEAARPAASRSSQRALVALWRLRADVLLGLSAGGLSENRDRQRRLGQTILRAAMRNPAAYEWSRDGELRSLSNILGIGRAEGSQDLQDDQVSWEDRVLILAEVAGMKIDAPLETKYDKSKARDLIITSGLDMLHGPLTSADFKPLRDRPAWQDLPCVGGGLGILEALSCGDPDTLVLRGHDPVGWLGWPYVAGRWLVQSSQHYPADALNNAAQLGANLAIAPEGQVAWPQTRLGDVAVQRIDRWRGELGSALDVYPPLAAPWVASPPEVRETLAVAQALGRRWVKVEATKIVTAYRILSHGEVQDSAASLPSLDQAIDHLEQAKDALGQLKAAEKQGSGTSSTGDNSVLKEWVDIEESVAAAHRSLLALAEKQAKI